MTHSEEILLSKILSFKHQQHKYDPLLERVLEQAEDEPLLKNLCAKVSVDLVDRIDSACGLLDISKRKFVELALIDLLDKFENLTAEYDMFGPHEVQKEGGKTNV